MDVEEGVTLRHTKAEMQVAAVEALLDRQSSMSSFEFGDDFVTVSVGEVRGALQEAAEEWEAIESGVPRHEFTDPMVQPPEDRLLPGQVWVWLAGAKVPHWEIKGMGVAL